MADFSHLVGPNPEWVEYASQNPIAATGLQDGQTPQDLRRQTNMMREAGAAKDLISEGLNKVITWTDYQVPAQDGETITARVYRTKEESESDERRPQAVYLFFHGGGFLFGSVESENAICGRVVVGCEEPVVVVSVCYRHTPEYVHPTQYNDAWNAYLWLSAHIAEIGGDPDKLVLGGVSAGGGLAASVVLRASNGEAEGKGLKIKGQVLCIPWLIHPDAYPVEEFKSPEVMAFHQNVEVPVLPRSQVDLFTRLLAVQDPTNDELFNVALASDAKLGKLPKTAVFAMGMDPLRDDALLYVEKLKSHGVPTKLHIFPGMPHGMRRYAQLASARRWDELVNESVDWVLSPNTASMERLEGKISSP